MLALTERRVRQSLRAALATARYLADDQEIVFKFSNAPLDPMMPPHDGKAIVMPDKVRPDDPHFLSDVRMRSDMGAAWLAEKQKQPYLDNLPDNAKAWLAYQALEKARREVRFVEEYLGSKRNIFERISMPPRNLANTGIRLFFNLGAWAFANIPSQHERFILNAGAYEETMAEGFYCAALVNFISDPSLLPKQVSLLGALWSQHISMYCPEFGTLWRYRDNPEEYAVYTRVLVDEFMACPTALKHFIDRQKLEKHGLQINHATRKYWLGLTIVELHAQLVSGQNVKLMQPSPRLAGNANSWQVLGVPNPFMPIENLDDGKWHYREPNDVADDGTVRNENKNGKNKKKRKKRMYSAGMNVVGNLPTPGQISGAIKAEPEAPTMNLSELYEQATADLQQKRRGGKDKHAPMMVDKLVELTARKADFFGVYRKLRGEHEVVKTVPQLVEDNERLATNWKRLKAKHPNVLIEARRMAQRLQQVLQSNVGTRMMSDSDDGEVDLSRLAQIVIAPDGPNYQIGVPHKTLDVAITLLFDYSGSMHGDPVERAGIISHTLSSLLEKYRIPIEVLGFTTEGYKSLQIVVKDFKTHTANAANHFGLSGMGIHMGGTSDADALLWASSRLLQRPEQRRILICISDVQPNESFLSTEFPDLRSGALLKSVIMQLETIKGIELIGLGIDAPYGNEFYSTFTNMSSYEKLATSLSGHLMRVLDPEHVNKQRRRRSLKVTNGARPA